MIVVMEPALDVLNRALHGDEGARSFLDRTSSIYVLDATDLSRPKTYGCWNFIHQAINEVERAEAASPAAKLYPHLQLLATMALRVARRSNALDQRLVATCIENAAKYHGSHSDAEKLITINGEIRDIVMGRIAALAFDSSFHTNNNASAFSDTVVMETFCAVLASNAVSNGPLAVNHLVSEWIVPEVANLPPFCLACVTLHLAQEAASKTAPENTQEMLQQLSATVMARVLAPVMADAIKERSNANTPPNQSSVGGLSSHERNCRTTALCLRAMNQWCAVTDLSLAQIKHVCGKVHINLTDLLSDAMYSDSKLVVDALAELIESVVERHHALSVTEARMTQVRYIMQVDEAAFRSNISPDQLVMIESKEMMSILEEIASAIGLQRFRFVDRQNNGDHDVCRNLARIGASVCSACVKLSQEGGQLRCGPGLLDLLIKSASHPSVSICAIALEVLADLVEIEAGLSAQLLPVLQRRAITPHHFDIAGVPHLVASADSYDATSYDEFHEFRETSLTKALLSCWKANAENYLASCTAAIEEFCGSNATAEVAFHLEAALFCMGSVADEAIAGSSDVQAAYTPFLKRCTVALGGKPASLTGNPSTLRQVCRFVHKYGKWFSKSGEDGVLDIGAEIALSSFNLCATNFPNEPISIEMKREADISPYPEAAKALQSVLCNAPKHFLSNQAISALGAGWEAAYAASNRTGIITVEERKSLCTGICHVLASLPENQRGKSLLALAMPALDCLETMIQKASEATANKGTSREQIDLIMNRISSEIVIVTTMARAFTDAYAVAKESSSSSSSLSDMESGCRTSDGRAAIAEAALAIVKRAWTPITRVASSFHYHPDVAESLGYFLAKCLPPECKDELSISFIKELCTLANSILNSDSFPSAANSSAMAKNTAMSFQPVLDFLHMFVKIHGDTIEKDARAAVDSRGSSSGGISSSNIGNSREIGTCLETLMLASVVAIQSLLGTAWTNAQRQGNGQPAFESSKAEDSKNDDKRNNLFLSNNRALSSMFVLLETCAKRCPLFLLHLPAGPGLDQNDDSLFRRAVESAVGAVLDSDVSTSKSAMKFLQSTLVLTEPSTSEDVRHTVVETISRVRSNLLVATVTGMCGKWNASNLDDAAGLWRTLLLTGNGDGTTSTNPLTSQEGIQGSLGPCLTNEYFLLGNRGRGAVLNFFLQTAKRQKSQEEVSKFLHEIWELHQVESLLESLEGSDAVAHFCKEYLS